MEINLTCCDTIFLIVVHTTSEHTHMQNSPTMCTYVDLSVTSAALFNTTILTSMKTCAFRYDRTNVRDSDLVHIWTRGEVSHTMPSIVGGPDRWRSILHRQRRIGIECGWDTFILERPTHFDCTFEIWIIGHSSRCMPHRWEMLHNQEVMVGLKQEMHIIAFCYVKTEHVRIKHN